MKGKQYEKYYIVNIEERKERKEKEYYNYSFNNNNTFIINDSLFIVFQKKQQFI